MVANPVVNLTNNGIAIISVSSLFFNNLKYSLNSSLILSPIEEFKFLNKNLNGKFVVFKYAQKSDFFVISVFLSFPNFFNCSVTKLEVLVK